MANSEFDKYVAEGDAYYKKKDWENAATAYTKALDIDDTDAHSLFNRAQCYCNLAEDEKALNDFIAYLETSGVPEHSEAAAHFGMGSCYFNMKVYDTADTYWTMCLESEEFKDLAYLLRLRGDARRLGECSDDEEYNDAIADYTACLKQEPDNAEALYGRGKLIWVFMDQENFPQAMNDFNAALEIDPDNADAWYLRGHLHQQKIQGYTGSEALAEAEQALEDWEKAAELDPGHEDAVYYRDGMRKALNREEGTEKLRSLIDRADKHFEDEEYDDAILDETEALKLIEGEDIKAFYSSEKLDDMKKHALYNRAGSYLRNINYNPAIEDLEAALKIDPDFTAAQEALDSAKDSIDFYKKISECSLAELRELADDGYDKKDYEMAASLYTIAANKGDAWCQMRTGYLYYIGEGVEKNIKKAARWFRKSAENGNASAQTNFGNMCYTGEAVEQDTAQAIKWWRKAADQGFAQAQNNLGLRYRDGDGVPKDKKQAIEWLTKAFEGGYEAAAKNLKEMGVTPKRPAAPSKPKDDAINFGSTWESVEAGLKEAKARGWTSLADINGSPEFKDKLYALSFEYNVELLNFTPSANALKLAKKRSKARSGKGNSVLAVLFGIFCGWNFMFTADWIASAIFEEVPVAVYLGSAAAAFIAAFVAWYLKATKTKILLTLLALGGLASIMGFLPSAASLFKSKSAAEAAAGTTAEAAAAVVIPDALNLRAEASGQSDVLKTLKKGDTLTINGEPVNGWMPVEHEGVKGFVSSELVKPKE